MAFDWIKGGLDVINPASACVDLRDHRVPCHAAVPFAPICGSPTLRFRSRVLGRFARRRICTRCRSTMFGPKRAALRSRADRIVRTDASMILRSHRQDCRHVGFSTVCFAMSRCR